MNVWGITRRYPALSWTRNFLGGHWRLGKRITIYGNNAMHWGVNIRTKRWGYICFRLPFTCDWRWLPLYFYLSPNGTPWASTFYRGKRDRDEKIIAQIRKLNFGHGFSTDTHSEALRTLNRKFEDLKIREFDIERYRESDD